MALEKPDQFFSCSGVRFNSVLTRSILASLLATICSAVSCGAPSWVSTACCCVPLAALLAFAFFPGAACFDPGAGAGSFFVGTPSTPVNTPTTPPIAPPSTPPTGPAALLPSLAPSWTPLTSPCALTAQRAFKRHAQKHLT